MTVSAAPPIVSRQAWGANPLSTPASGIEVPTPELWLHHTASSGLHGASGMRSLQANAIAGGYVDLEYTVCVDTDGTIFMSRGIGRDTAATKNHNSISHAICALGQFDSHYAGTQQPTQQLLDGIASCVAWLYANGAIRSKSITGPHGAASGNSTACCGDLLIAQIGEINRRAGGASGGGVAPSPTPPPSSGGAAPPFPYPSSDYLGQPSSDPHCHSGFYGGVDTSNVRTWQQRMRDRGWSIGVDGKYGPQSEDVCRSFQQEKGLGVDGLCGPQTWGASWTAPIT
jgi:putative peptidoglycan binding protein/N-acetylmuramoyl-L-alanine amidase-like protein